jgi:hypothetical protein
LNLEINVLFDVGATDAQHPIGLASNAQSMMESIQEITDIRSAESTTLSAGAESHL